MTLTTVIAPSEIILVKVLILGFFFGWSSKRFLRPKVREISNYKYLQIQDSPTKIKL